jgi:hypothetical protein
MRSDRPLEYSKPSAGRNSEYYSSRPYSASRLLWGIQGNTERTVADRFVLAELRKELTGESLSNLKPPFHACGLSPESPGDPQRFGSI